MTKAHKCSRCRRLRRGHVGPSGPKCSMSLLKGDADREYPGPQIHANLAHSAPKQKHVQSTDNGEVDSDTSNDSRATPPPVDPFLNELAAQLGQLNLNFQEQSKDNREMKADLTQIKLLSRSIPEDGAPFRVRPDSSHDTRHPYMSPAAPGNMQPLGNRDAHSYGNASGILSGGPDSPVSLTNGARVSQKVVAAAKAGEYADLANFIPNNEPSNLMETVIDEDTSQVVFRSKSAKKSIDSFLTWSQAWAGYEEIIMQNNMSIYLKCASYKLFIQKHNALYTWTSVTMYDQRFRHKLSMLRSFEFDVVDTNIAFILFNSMSVRPNHKGCFRCGSIDHHQKTCPFSTGGALEKAAQTPKKQGKPSQGYASSNQGSNSQAPSYSYNRA
jgi:hypothetical protein